MLFLVENPCFKDTKSIFGRVLLNFVKVSLESLKQGKIILFNIIVMDETLRSLGEQLRREVIGKCRAAEVRNIKKQIREREEIIEKEKIEQNEKS